MSKWLDRVDRRLMKRERLLAIIEKAATKHERGMELLQTLNLFMQGLRNRGLLSNRDWLDIQEWMDEQVEKIT